MQTTWRSTRTIAHEETTMNGDRRPALFEPVLDSLRTLFFGVCLILLYAWLGIEDFLALILILILLALYQIGSGGRS